MGKKNKQKHEKAKQKAEAYIANAQSDGQFTGKELSKATGKHGISMDDILNRAATQGIQIDRGAQKQFGISQDKNTNRIEHSVAINRGHLVKGQMVGGDKSSAPKAQKHGAYRGVDKKGAHVYRYGAGQPESTAQSVAAAPVSAQASQPASQEQFTPSDPQQGKSWNAYISASDQGDQSIQSSRSSYQSSSDSPYDPGNPDLYGAVAEKGQDYQKRFGKFVDYAQNNAMTQSNEIGHSGRSNLSRLQATPATLDDPLSAGNAKRLTAFSKALNFK